MSGYSDYKACSLTVQLHSAVLYRHSLLACRRHPLRKPVLCVHLHARQHEAPSALMLLTCQQCNQRTLQECSGSMPAFSACSSSQITATEDMLQNTKLTSHVWRRHNLPAKSDGSRLSMADMLLKPDVTLQQVCTAQLVHTHA